MWFLLQTDYLWKCVPQLICSSISLSPQLLMALLSPSSPYHGSFAAIHHKQSPSLLITLLKKLFLVFLTAPSSCATAELHWLVAHGGMAWVQGTKSQLLCPPHKFDSDKIPSWIFSGLVMWIPGVSLKSCFNISQFMHRVFWLFYQYISAQ